ncbi:MAG: sigma factor-like helix-turn-helix DNA-binding protein [Clostridia bacterium]|nr:sigma factor-like helix-turn-helix DNA-binding protein [Clostridia bacterium]
MEKNVKMTLLYDIYGKLLTNRQQEIFTEYYLYNLSLREIAENRNISYQAVRDSVKSSENMLENFEEKIHMFDLLERIDKAYNLCDSKDLNEKRNEIKKLLKDEDDIDV